MSQMLMRFVVGGAVVSLFALLGDLLRPKGFAGLFAAAPSVALATLSLAAISQGTDYAATEAASMICGAAALAAYAAGCVYFLGIRHAKAGPTAVLMLPVWALVAAILYFGILK